MAVASEFPMVGEFDCRNCGTRLALKSLRGSSWLRCPKCGKASLPSAYYADFYATKYVRLPEDSLDDPLTIEDDPRLSKPHPLDFDREPEGEDKTDTGPALSVRRAVSISIVCLSVTLLIFSVMQRNQAGGTIFSTGAVAGVLLFIWPTKRRRSFDR